MLETPGVARHRATMPRTDAPADEDEDQDEGDRGSEPAARCFDGAAERARLIARGVLRPADDHDRRTEWITRGRPCLTINRKGSP